MPPQFQLAAAALFSVIFAAAAVPVAAVSVSAAAAVGAA